MMKRKGSSIRREAISSATEHWTALNNRIDPKKKTKEPSNIIPAFSIRFFFSFEKFINPKLNSSYDINWRRIDDRETHNYRIEKLVPYLFLGLKLASTSPNEAKRWWRRTVIRQNEPPTRIRPLLLIFAPRLSTRTFSSTNKYIDRRHRSRILYLPRSRGFRLRFRFEKNDRIEGELILQLEN